VKLDPHVPSGYKTNINTANGNVHPETACPSTRKCHLLLFTAQDKESLTSNIAAIENVSTKYNLEDLAYTLAVRRSHFSARAYAIVYGNPSNHLETSFQDAVVSVSKVSTDKPALGFVFTGQGAQWPKMGRELLLEFPYFRKVIKELDEVLQSTIDKPDWYLEGMQPYNAAD
jgi:acyl transferase domain-containing protein